MLGILLADKPVGITSHDAVDRIRRTFGTRRVGHAGTLDPLATGLLVIAVGPATRFLQYLPLEPKEYEARVVFGESRTTFDAEGEVVETSPVPTSLRERLEETLPAFLGLITQMPPMYSAVKVKGQALYKYARKGQEVERTARTIHVGRIDILDADDRSASLRIECSGGTYIRTLADDLGKAVGCGAYLAGLKRTRVGRFELSQAVALEQAGPEDLVSLADALPPLPLCKLSEPQVRSIREGRAVMLADPPEGPLCALQDEAGNVFSVARVNGNMAQPECVIPAEVVHEAS